MPEPTKPKPRARTSRRRPTSWPLALQVLGLVAICWGVGMLVGFAWALISSGVAAVVVGVANEAP